MVFFCVFLDLYIENVYTRDAYRDSAKLFEGIQCLYIAQSLVCLQVPTSAIIYL